MTSDDHATSPADYRRIEKAISFLSEHARDQPSLEALARHLGLSPYHCHRLFHRWAGVTPKDFVRLATLSHAKALLRRPTPVLEAALEAGLSGPGRLHDLFLSVEAMTPGEYGRKGAGLRIAWGVHATPVGEGLIASTPRGVCAIHFLQTPGDRVAGLAGLRMEWPGAEFVRDQRATQFVAEEISGRMRGRMKEPLSLLLRGTPFQVQVWQALLAIPPGCIASYSGVAAAVGRPNAVRATASAIGANAISYLIPCHRVLRSTGAAGGYRWGEPRKRALLALETRTAFE